MLVAQLVFYVDVSIFPCFAVVACRVLRRNLPFEGLQQMKSYQTLLRCGRESLLFSLYTDEVIIFDRAGILFGLRLGWQR